MFVRYTTSLTLLCILLMSLQSCIPASDSELHDKALSLNDSVLKSIFNYQNSHDIDSLTALFSHNNSFVRKAAAEAFGSMKVKGSAYKLGTLMQDESLDVKATAAYAVGQIGGLNAEDLLVKSFMQNDSTYNLNNAFNRNILESIGKIGTIENLKNIAKVSTYQNTDNELVLGQARAIYQYALRDQYDEDATARMMDLLSDEEVAKEARLVAANYFYRAKNIDIETFKFQIAKQLQNNPSAEIRMACAAALAKTKDPEIGTILMNQLTEESDYRVRCNIIRALSNFNYNQVVNTIFESLADENINVAQLAAEYIYVNGNARDIKLYRALTENNYPWQVQSGLYKAILRHVPNRYMNTRTIVQDEVETLYNTTKSNYAKAAYLKAMAEDVLNYKAVYELAKDNNSAVVKTALVQSFKSALESPKWAYAYNTRAKDRYAKGELSSYLEAMVANGDVGQLAEIGQLYADQSINLKSNSKDYSFLNQAIHKLSLPKDLESFNFLVDAINYLQDTTMQKIESLDVKDIDWTLLKEVTDSTSATIRTNRGDVLLVLKPSKAPGTVSNFIRLAQDNFYDDKVFHRVVPNFVAQGGCPRGDGYGSLDYTIRTEVPGEHFDAEGKVGMASAGNHTESCQFFITHSPAMHLDGNYTIFAEVIEGMEIVHQLQIGDRINDVIIHTL